MMVAAADQPAQAEPATPLSQSSSTSTPTLAPFITPNQSRRGSGSASWTHELSSDASNGNGIASGSPLGTKTATAFPPPHQLRMTSANSATRNRQQHRTSSSQSTLVQPASPTPTDNGNKNDDADGDQNIAAASALAAPTSSAAAATYDAASSLSELVPATSLPQPPSSPSALSSARHSAIASPNFAGYQFVVAASEPATADTAAVGSESSLNSSPQQHASFALSHTQVLPSGGHERQRSYSRARAASSHAPRESSIIEMGTSPVAPLSESADSEGNDASDGASNPLLMVRRWSDDQVAEIAAAAPAENGRRISSNAAGWLDATSNMLRSSFSSSQQPPLPTSMREVRPGSIVSPPPGQSSASSSPSFGSVRFTGRTGAMSAGPSPSMGPRRYTGTAAGPGYSSAGPSPPFVPTRYTGSAGPSPSSGPVRFTGSSGAASIVSNASTSASGTSVLSYASTSGASSCSSPPPPSVSSFPSNGGQAPHSVRSDQEWTEYLHDGELQGRQRGLDKALELLRERSRAAATTGAAAVTKSSAMSIGGGGATAEEIERLMDSCAATPDDPARSWYDDVDVYFASKGHVSSASTSSPALAYKVAASLSPQPASSPMATLRALLTFAPLQLARFLRWLARLNTPALLCFLLLFISFVTSTTLTIKYILNPDKEPKPWRLHCAKEATFPHNVADKLAPVDVFVGVFSMDANSERRSAIRHTYAAHTLPLSPHDGQPMANVQVKFILGRPRARYAHAVALEQEMYNDVVLLNTDENMNHGKTFEFFRWASENATIPIVLGPPASPAWSSQSPSSSSSKEQVPENGGLEVGSRKVRWKMADYVVKADEDAFIVLSELERHLRIIPRTKTYWGYLIADKFMAGECYALSQDLVQWISHSQRAASLSVGKEDKQVAKMLLQHPEAATIHYKSQHCWIYDHPKAGTAYSHGFLFPDYVKDVKNEIRYGLSSAEIGRRGGPRAALSYSTVSKWKQPYKPPRKGMSIEEQVEALVEGGGRWASNGGVRNAIAVATYPRKEIVYDADDVRLRPASFLPNKALPQHHIGQDPHTGLSIYPLQEEEGRASLLREDARSPSPPPAQNEHLRKHAAAIVGPYATDKMPAPISKDEGGALAAVRKKRYLGRPHGGTIVVHYIKKHEWFLETALALLGKPTLRVDGAGGPGSEFSAF
ncbi:glycosyltransferase family 31 protein [Tilletiaria anomala UBC 951]|uniref:Glycosyltransferase family 31 protein n=1 Tax=Tilletiaria anomala (strain ATCC 24038 / CBS 436.72 / UBC 951) TaxID=1037660 RepID=A0A066W581_TILAU|nr:glycosyltransferase family 31 protein [Tilletiaria anomala UBC 951]KDN48861.1 glycosyltransferase family 31 protein [Tilletiaria anomala UBC 951]